VPEVLTTNALIRCPHTFDGESQSFDPTWSINGGNVLVEGDRGLLLCTNTVPCVGYTLRSMGLNATRIKGKKVVLVTDFNQTDTGLPLTIFEENGIFDDTTPAPIPDGQDGPPLPPAMTDMAKPTVTIDPPPPLFEFTITTSSPATLSATFKLVSAHPLQWILIMLHEPEPNPDLKSEDLTSNQPAGLTLTETGGVWNVSPLEITLTMTATYMATLGVFPLVHRFFMIAVSQRGVSSFVELVLTVKP